MARRGGRGKGKHTPVSVSFGGATAAPTAVDASSVVLPKFQASKGKGRQHHHGHHHHHRHGETGSSGSRSSVIFLKASISRALAPEFQLWRRWFCTDAVVSRVLTALNSRLRVLSAGSSSADVSTSLTMGVSVFDRRLVGGGGVASRFAAADSPEPILLLDQLPNDNVTLALASLTQALRELGSNESSPSSWEPTENRTAEIVAALVQVAEEAVPFHHSVPFRSAASRSPSTENGPGPVQRFYSAFDIKKRLCDVERVANLVRVRNLAQRLRGSASNMDELLAYRQLVAAARLRATKAAVRGSIGAVEGNQDSDYADVRIPTLRTRHMETHFDDVVMALPVSGVTGTAGAALAMSSAPSSSSSTGASFRSSTSRLLRAVAAVLDSKAQPNSDSWGAASRVKDRFVPAGGIWLELGEEREVALKAALAGRRLLGLPVFLRSLRRPVPLPSVAAGGVVAHSDNRPSAASLFPTSDHLPAAQFDITRHCTDVRAVDQEIEEDICGDGVLKLVVIAGDADVVTQLLWEYVTETCDDSGASRCRDDVNGAAATRLSRMVQRVVAGTEPTVIDSSSPLLHAVWLPSSHSRLKNEADSWFSLALVFGVVTAAPSAQRDAESRPSHEETGSSSHHWYLAAALEIKRRSDALP